MIKTTAGTPSASEATLTATAAKALPVRAGEDPWSEAEIGELKAELGAEVVRLREQLRSTSAELNTLLGDNAGLDQIDIGSSHFERDHEMTMASTAQHRLDGCEEALRLIDAGEFGRCRSCGQAIGKGRLQAFPQADVCISCKQAQESRAHAYA